MPTFSLSAKPPKPKAKKEKKVVVRSTGRGGSGNIARKKVTAATLETPVITYGTPSIKESNASVFSQTATKTSISGSTDWEVEDKVQSPFGREVAPPRNRKILSGRGGVGNVTVTAADEGVFERVLAHEQAIVESIRERRGVKKGARSTGRGGMGNIKKVKGTPGSDASSFRTGSSGNSWNSSVAQRIRSSALRSSKSSSSLTGAPAISAFSPDVFVTSLSPLIPEDVIGEAVDDGGSESFAASLKRFAAINAAMNVPSNTSTEQFNATPVPSTNTSTAALPAPTSTTTAPKDVEYASTTGSQGDPLSRFDSPLLSSVSSFSGSRMQPPSPLAGPVGSTSKVASTQPSPILGPAVTVHKVLSATAGKATTPLASTRANGSPVIRAVPGSPIMRAVPGTTTLVRSNLAAPQLPIGVEQPGNRLRSSSSAPLPLNRLASLPAPVEYANQAHSTMSPIPEAAAPPQHYYPRTAYDPSQAPRRGSDSQPESSTKRVGPPPRRPLPPNPSPIPSALSPTSGGHSRQLSGDSTGGSSLDLSRYNFPDAPGHEPSRPSRGTSPALQAIVVGSGGEAMLRRVNPERPPVSIVTNRVASRAPIQPGAYKNVRRPFVDDEADSPPPSYEPPSSIELFNHEMAQRAERSRAATSGQPTTRATPPLRLSRTAQSSSSSTSPVVDRGSSGSRSLGVRGPSRRPSALLSGRQNSNEGFSELAYINDSPSATAPPSPRPAFLDSPMDYTPNEPKGSRLSRPYSMLRRGDYAQTISGSQVTATAVDHHEHDFPPLDDDDEAVFYSSIFGELDDYDSEHRKVITTAISNKWFSDTKSRKEFMNRGSDYTRGGGNGKTDSFVLVDYQNEPIRSPQHQPQSSPALQASPAPRRLPLRPIRSPTPKPASVPYYPDGLEVDDLSYPAPRKLSRMEKALLRRVEFGQVAAGDMANIPLA